MKLLVLIIAYMISALNIAVSQDFDYNFYNLVWEKSLTPEFGVPDEYFGSRIHFTCMNCLDKNNCIVMGIINKYPNVQFPPEEGFSRITGRTTDGGQSWKFGKLSEELEGSHRIFEAIAPMRSIVMVDSLTAIAVGDSGIVVRTRDGGMTWDRIHNAAPQKIGAGFRGVTFTPDRAIGMAVGAYGIISITSDTGTTWDTKELWLFPTIYQNVVSPANNVFYVFDSFYAKMFRTFDAGTTWDTLSVYKNYYRGSSSIITQDSQKQGGVITAHFVTPELGWLSAVERHKENTPDDRYKVISRTTDSGRTWVVQRSELTSNQDTYNSIAFADEGTGMVGSFDGTALFSIAGGYWRETTPLFSQNNPAIRMVQYKDIHIGLAFLGNYYLGGSDFGGIYRFRRVPITSVDEVQGWGSNPYFWVQTAPNPAVSTVRARLFGLYSIKTREVTAKVYDMMGNVVYDASREATDGNNGAWSDLTFSVEGWAPGVYLLGMQAEGAGFARAFVVSR